MKSLIVTTTLIFLGLALAGPVGCKRKSDEGDKKKSSSTDPHQDEFYEKMKKKHGDTIAKKFTKILFQKASFTVKYHQMHIEWSREADSSSQKATCGVVGCHPGGDDRKLPPVPQSCYTCHQPQTKIPRHPFPKPDKKSDKDGKKDKKVDGMKKNLSPFAKKMYTKHEGTIQGKFDKVLAKKGNFTALYHQTHMTASLTANNFQRKKSCGVVGCHPGGDEKKLPPVPQTCYTCHDKNTKVPERNFK